eukprot:c19525_g1_i1 orf=453-1265(+)
MASDQGRGRACLTAIIVSLFTVWQCKAVSAATTFTVGDTKGWDVGVNYAQWVQGKTFNPGDILYFPYVQASHSVIQVSSSNYELCSTANPISNDQGAGNTQITLSKSGSYYFICGVEGHCQGGMKLAVSVGAAATPAPSTSKPLPPAPAPSSTTPIPSPAPSPSKPPTPAPISSPVPALASSPAPNSSPTPAASTPAPSPSPTSTSPSPALASSTAPSPGTSTSPVPSGSPSSVIQSPPPQNTQNAGSKRDTGVVLALASALLSYGSVLL